MCSCTYLADTVEEEKRSTIKVRPVSVHRYYRPFFKILRQVEGFAIVSGGAARRMFELDNAVLMSGDVDIFADSPETITRTFHDLSKSGIETSFPMGMSMRGTIQRNDFYQRCETIVNANGKKSLEMTITSNIWFTESSSGRRPDKTPVQLVLSKFAPDIERLFESFDFTVCQFATDGINIYYTEDAERDLKKKKLRLVKNAIADERSAIRSIKYIEQYGFTPDFGIIEAMARQSKISDSENARFTKRDDFYP